MSTYEDFKAYLGSEQYQQFLRMTDEEIRRAAEACAPPEYPSPPGEILELVKGPDGVWALPEETPDHGFSFNDFSDTFRFAATSAPGSPYFYAKIAEPPIRPFWDFGGIV